MKYIKKYESVIPGYLEYFDKFFEYFNRFKSINKNDAWTLYIVKNNNIPESLFDEYNLLAYYYEHWCRSFGNEIFNKKLKNELKIMSKNSIIEKIENDLNVYKDIEVCLKKNKGFNNKGSFSNISNPPVKYFMFFLESFIKKDLPDWIKNAIKFNV